MKNRPTPAGRETSDNRRDDRDIVLASLSSDAGQTPDDNEPLPPAKQGAMENARANNPTLAVADFIAAAENNAATVSKAATLDAVPPATAAILAQHRMSPAVLCSLALLDLDWAAASVAVECRMPMDDDKTGVTLCPAAAADSGAMLFTDDDPHALTMSLLPPLHIVVLPTKNIVPDLRTLWARLPADNLPSSACLVCGPSRTADIEQTFVLGMHGPLMVHIILIGE